MRHWLLLFFFWVSGLRAQALVQLHEAIDAEQWYAWTSANGLQVEAICGDWGLYYLQGWNPQTGQSLPECVRTWQLERAVERRYTPNDEQLSLQKYLPLIGAPSLWDFQRTNTTRRGTELVVALVDDGLDTSHPDLVENIWTNPGEIPWNGIDDDNNGYVDDYYGWNSGDKSPSVFNAESVYYEHGTMVGGVLGARGDNSMGVSGVAPVVKLLPILCYPSNGVDTDLGVIRGMVYAYKQKQLWLQTQGQKGAPISVLNMSVGMDNAFPEDAPIWCAMFDSLGSVGILSVAATTNQNIDIGSSGDIPSLCSSSYLVVVSNSDISDNPVGSGYSSEYVDLAAPGEGVHTTRVYSKNPTNPYKSGGGTSFAAPQVSGSLLLMHAESCFAYLDLRNQNPDSALRLMRSWLLAGVDTISAFSQRNATSGRLHSFKAFQLMHDWCMVHDPLYQTRSVSRLGIRMMPNPAAETVRIEIDSPVQHVYVYSVLGKLMYSGSFAEAIDVSLWPSGVYCLTALGTNGERTTQSFAVER